MISRSRTLGFAAAIFVCSSASSAYAGEVVRMCRDQSGNPYFSDVGCPADTQNVGTFYARDAQTYERRFSPREVQLVNQYDQRTQRNVAARAASIPKRSPVATSQSCPPRH